jgi:archaellum component FlaC
MTESSSKAINRLAELIAVSREATDRQLAALATTVEQTTRNVDHALEGIRQSADRMEQSANRMEQSVERIEHQVGRMSEHLTAIDIKIERLADKIDRLADRIDELTKAVNGHLEVAKQQSTNIAELTKLVATQANTVAMLISRTG